MWAVATTDDFDAWFKSIGDDEKAEIIAKVELLKIFGPSLKRPHADTLKGSRHANMKELRGSTDKAVLRVAFAFDLNRVGILLTAGNKSGVSEQRFYKALVAKADKLFDEHLEALRKEGK